MPLYEFHCFECNEDFETICKVGEENSVKCPKNTKHKIEKKISLPSFQLKGNGWYKDGYSNKPNDSVKKESSTVNSSKTTSVKETKV